ncbi:MAG: sugar phosphate isomerase/epimerase [Actinobacteria bacterium]|nr:sugar phosphate isomerase/epimerase [Actinomycetota bacterium]
MRIGVFLLIKPFASVEEQLKAAQAMGFKAADITDTNAGGSMLGTAGFSPTVSIDDNPFDVKRLFEKYGMSIATICAHGNLIDPPKPSRYGTHEIMRAVQMAAAIGVKDVITTESEAVTEWGEKLTTEQATLLIAEKLYEPVRLAHDYGVRVLIENHGPITDTPEGLKKIFDLLDNHPALGMNLDTGNSWLGGSDPVEIAKMFKDKIHHIHWKDLGEDWLPKRGKQFGCGFSTIAMGEGIIDIKGICDVLKDTDIEFSTLEIVGGPENFAKSVKYLNSLGVGL